ncbi:hypothetical protein Sgleb_26100 [Streptomyces glebosus]|uniref:Uncharacterized protein n=1 Tax=Streptomyces glebosus TaxID=249580 RepID=A0A640SSZ6_9ACTN|nr:hypothetical protein Sgleb_26100 [Streptomyces glebosus]GHG56222.1 hypothetical protein GCM10010513_18940 [Streptomyces glebosus]
MTTTAATADTTTAATAERTPVVSFRQVSKSYGAVRAVCDLGLAFLGGLWMPLTILPQWMQNIAEWLPTHAYAALGTAVEAGGAPHLKDVAILAGYLLVFTAGAAGLYRKDTHKA